ncbi:MULTISPECIES: radical SAM protein [unclassified Thermosipho (in: thermotogales)]|uniref:radical SAM/SPASM domain-containing protein n=1 Tax=unclassified Thermosipho (in: thermotogales) TaxID=2676525 RepID=UPI0009865837|nr:radical SAM protein [Thermosipho sp. 1223]MBT1247819.1 hypothetical protein [Thermosipho sp. 1244]OOC46037.1 hypothetical protein XO09_08525 [Thermosipho sp. 1223]
MKLSKYNILIEKEEYLILFNTISNAMLYVEQSKKNKIKKMCESKKVKISEFEPDEIETLKKGFFILDDDFDEVEYLKLRFNAYRYSDRYLRYTIVLTEKCNFNCVYCYQQQIQSVSGKMASEIQEEQISQLIEETKRRFESQKPKVLSVTFYGGEPLLSLEKLIFISEKFRELSKKYQVEYRPFIVTNGYLLNKITAKKLIKVGIRSVIITIDGTEEIHDKYRRLLNGGPTFSKLIENIEKIHKDMQVQLRINISKESVNSVKKLISFIVEKRLNVTFDFQMIEVVKEFSNKFEDTPLTLKEFSKIEIELYKEILKYLPEYSFNPFKNLKFARCDALCLNSFVIDVDGSVHKCWGEVGNKVTIAGKLTNEGIKLNQKYTKWLAYEPYEDKECQSCIVFPACMGGCTFNAVVVDKLHGSPVKKPYRCIPMKYNIKDIIEVVANQQLKLRTYSNRV